MMTHGCSSQLEKGQGAPLNHLLQLALLRKSAALALLKVIPAAQAPI